MRKARYGRKIYHQQQGPKKRIQVYNFSEVEPWVVAQIYKASKLSFSDINSVATSFSAKILRFKKKFH